MNILNQIRITKLNSTQTILGSFFLAIILGATLLSLPISSKAHTSTDFLTCIFTSTSAICVTGLVVVDTATPKTQNFALLVLSF